MIFDIIIALMPVYAYYSQLMLIRKQKSIGSFSIYVCAIILIANILRIFFWFTVGFAVSLLIQSVCVIAIMLLLLKECVEVSDHFIKDTSIWQKFWKWETYHQYVKFLLGLVAALTVITLVLQIFTFGYFGQFIGFLSLSIEAMLGFPQLYSNWKSQSVKGVSLTMIAMWFIGDFGKTIYFIMRAQPFQFIMCGFIQLVTDTFLLMQMLTYGKDYSNVESDLPQVME